MPIGADMMPLLSGQVDAVTGWQTNTTALKPLGADRVDCAVGPGVRLYALPYYTTTDTLNAIPTVSRFLKATARGWIYANGHRDRRSISWSRRTRTSTAPTSASPSI